MLLVMDVGNTNTSLGVFDGESLTKHWRLTTERARTVDEYGVHARNLFAFAGLDFKAITAVAVASVVPQLNYTLKRMSEVYFHLSPLFIDNAVDTGLDILYDPPSDVGADRIVDAVPPSTVRRACIVVDFGTATNFEVIDADGRYLGGVLTPGIQISSDALFARAARLPRVAIERPRTVIGASTVAAIQSGLYYGYAGLVDGILRRMIEELGHRPRVVATGGLAPLIATASEFIDVVDKTLTLDGLRLVYERNRGGEGG